jgi:VIT1/CCC1 family predicted Fe2+/Mn2+ transporter
MAPSEKVQPRVSSALPVATPIPPSEKVPPAVSSLDQLSSSSGAQPSSASSAIADPAGLGSSSGGARRLVLFWGTAGAVLVAGGALLPLLPGYFLPHTSSARVILLTIAAVTFAAVTVAAANGSGRFFRRRETLQQ